MRPGRIQPVPENKSSVPGQERQVPERVSGLPNRVRVLSDGVRAVLDGGLELLYPSNIYCCCCGDTIDPDMPYSLCGRCVREIHWTLTELETRDAGGKALHLFSRGYSCARYESRTKQILRRFKYGSEPQLAKALARLMLERIEGEELRPDVVIPVPMYRRKERVRGYNQAALLAAEIAGELSVPFEERLLLRQKETGAMSALSAQDRSVNLGGAFRTAENAGQVLQGASVLLVDDIVTTGTTADECSKVLLEAGAKEITLLVFAAGEGGDAQNRKTE